MVAHTCNSSYAESGDQEDQSQSRQKNLERPPSQSISKARCCEPLVPAIQETLAGGSQPTLVQTKSETLSWK
jgi:hypothetical protein